LISALVTFELFDPELRVCRWRSPTFDPRSAVPKVSIHEHGELGSPKDEVGSSEYFGVVPSKAQPQHTESAC
jgi:hypothetical protein